MVTKAVSRSRRQSEIKEPVPSSSTEQEEEEEEEHSLSSDDASGETPIPNPNPDNGSDSDSDLGSPSDYMLKPVEPRKRAKQESEIQPPAAKKSKTAAGAGAGPSNPSGCIVRLWSDEDEVTLLYGIIDYNNSTGRSFNADLGAFFSYIKGKLQMDFRRDQLATKIRRLKKRFSDASNKGEGLVFSKPHDAEVFELCDKIWGAAAGNVSVAAEKGKSVKNVKELAVDVESDDEKEKENHHGNPIKNKKSKALKDLAVDVESDEKENDAGKSDKKKRKAVQELAVDVESDEKENHHGKALKKKGKAVKEHAVNVESDEMEIDAGKSDKKKAKALKKRADKVEMNDQKKSDAGTSVQNQEVGVIELNEKKEEDEEEKVGAWEKENNAGKSDKKKAKALKKCADKVEMDDQKKSDAGTSVQNQEVGVIELDEKKEDEEEKVGAWEKENKAGKSDTKTAKNLKKCTGKVEMDDQKKSDASKSVEKQEVGVNELGEKKKDGKEKVREEEGVDFQSKYPFLSDSFSSLSSSLPSMFMPKSLVITALKRLSSIGDGNAKELDDKWKELALEENALNHKKLTLMMEQVRMSFDH